MATGIGGLAGLSDGTIRDAYATGDVTGGEKAGGLAGDNFGTIIDAYATGAVSGSTTSVGGFVGYNRGSIAKAYSTGVVSTSVSFNGGFLGWNNGGTVTKSYWDTTTSGTSHGIGVDDNNQTVTGRNTARLAAALPHGFSSSIWGNGNNQTLPYLLDVTSNPQTVLLADGDPIQILFTIGQVQAIADNLSGTYGLGTNIDASATSSWNSGAGFMPLGDGTTQFTGIFNGLGYTINGLTIDRPTTWYVGLFGYSTGTIENVGLVGGSVTGDSYTGGLVGQSGDDFETPAAGTISNVYNTGTVNGGDDRTGGVVGFAFEGTISNSYATGAVSGTANVGGLVGVIDYTTISNSHADGAVSGHSQAGGLVGWLENGTVNNSYATGAVNFLGTVNGFSKDFGGLVAENNGAITSSYATGAVNGVNHVGGLIGAQYGGGAHSVTDSYATGDVSGTSDVGGLVGHVEYASNTIADVYASGAVTGSANVGGVIGFTDGAGAIIGAYWDRATTGLTAGCGSGSCTGAHGLGATAAHTQSKYAAFDFGSTWFMIDGQTRPFLQSEYSTTIVNAHQLQLMAMDPAAHYKLGANIDFSDEFTADSHGRYPGMWGAEGFVPVGDNSTPFTGIFDGLGHTISNLFIDDTMDGSVGLFGHSNGTIENVGLVGGSVAGSNGNTGALVGDNEGTITDAYATMAVSGAGSDVGGLVGENMSMINTSHATGTVAVQGSGHYGTSYDGGGLVGANDGTVTDSYATGAVNGDSRTSDLGGLVGGNYNRISESYATGAVSGGDTTSGSYDVGGLVGANYSGVITNAYATGSVSGYSQIGGLVGLNDGTINATYSTGVVSGSAAVGGLVGNGSGTPAHSYWDTETSGQSSSHGGTGLTTAQLQLRLRAGFSGSTWSIVAGKSFPYLNWQFSGTPEVVSGMALNIFGGSAVADREIDAFADGAALSSALTGGGAITGANGYYYFLLAPDTLENAGGSVLVYRSGSGGAAFEDGVSNSVNGLDIYGHYLNIETGFSSYATASSDLTAAVGGDASVQSLLDGLGNLVIDATNTAFSVDSAIGESGIVRLDGAGTVTESGSGKITAGTLAGLTHGAANLTAVNHVSKLSTFKTTGNAFNLSNALDLTTTGTVNTGHSNLTLATTGTGHDVIINSVLRGQTVTLELFGTDSLQQLRQDRGIDTYRVLACGCQSHRGQPHRLTGRLHDQ